MNKQNWDWWSSINTLHICSEHRTKSIDHLSAVYMSAACKDFSDWNSKNMGAWNILAAGLDFLTSFMLWWEKATQGQAI